MTATPGSRCSPPSHPQLLQISKLGGDVTCSGLHSPVGHRLEFKRRPAFKQPSQPLFLLVVGAGRSAAEPIWRVESTKRSPPKPSSESFCSLSTFSGDRRRCIYVPKESLDPGDGGPTRSHSRVSLKCRLWAGLWWEAGLQRVKALGHGF